MAYDVSNKWPECFIDTPDGGVEVLTVELHVQGMLVSSRDYAGHRRAARIENGHLMCAYSDSGHVRWGHQCAPGKCGQYK